MSDEMQGKLPPLARSALHGIASQLATLGQAIERLERTIPEWHRADATSRRLATIVASGNDPARQGTDRVRTRSVGPRIGPITAGAIAATVPDVSLFRSGRQFAA
jgi:transposase